MSGGLWDANVLLLLANSSLYRSGKAFIVAGGASDTSLLQLCGGDAARAQRAAAWVQVACSCCAVPASALAAAWMDQVGRRRAIICAELAGVALRLSVVRRLTWLSYISDRIGSNVIFHIAPVANTAALADTLGGFASDRFHMVTSKSKAVQEGLRLLTLYLASRLAGYGPRASYGVAAVVHALAALSAYFMKETLSKEERKPMTFQNSQPLAWTSVFGRTRRLQWLAAAAVASFAAMANSGQNLGLRHKFGWGSKQIAEYHMRGAIIEAFFQWMGAGPRILKALGNQAAAAWDFRLGILQDLNKAFAPDARLLLLNHVFEGLRHSRVAMRAEASLEVGDAVGQGALQGSFDGLDAPLWLFMPPIFAELFRINPDAGMVLATVLRLFGSEVALRAAYWHPSQQPPPPASPVVSPSERITHALSRSFDRTPLQPAPSSLR